MRVEFQFGKQRKQLFALHSLDILHERSIREEALGQLHRVLANFDQATGDIAEMFCVFVKPIVQQVFPISEVSQAHQLSEAGRVVGKLVLDMQM